MKLNDESQYLVSSEFAHILHQPTEFEFSFTATKKLAEHIGMNNEKILIIDKKTLLTEI